MKYALIDGKRTVASKGAQGICPVCNSKLIAKCGLDRIDHWSHYRKLDCDPWWENETEWHRNWKNQFPEDWQEFTFTDPKTGEKHIADVYTEHGLVMEFQHSHIDPKERISREKFYKNMVWIVDGSRLKRDFPRFLNNLHSFQPTNKQNHFIVNFPEKSFPKAWLNSNVPVVFDFLGLDIPLEKDDYRKPIYCLYPNRNNNSTVVARTSRELFVEKAIEGILFNKHRESQKPKGEPSQQNPSKRPRREPTHYYDPKKKRMVKKWRF